MPSKSLYWHTFGSLTNALREAGFDVPVGEERLERAVEQGVALAREARAAAEVRRLGRGAARGRLAPDRVAGLPDVRRAARRLVDVPVPRAPAPRRSRAWTSRATERCSASYYAAAAAIDGEAREAVRALARGPDGRQRRLPRRSCGRGGSARCGRRGRRGARGTSRPAPRSSRSRTPRVLGRRSRARCGWRRRRPRRGRGRARAAGRRRGRRRRFRASRWSSQAVAIEPESASSARGSFCECAASAKIASESTRHPRLGARAGVGGEQLVVVER